MSNLHLKIEIPKGFCCTECGERLSAATLIIKQTSPALQAASEKATNEFRGPEDAPIDSLLETYFDQISFEDSEAVLSDLVQSFLYPQPDERGSDIYVANTVYSVRRITNLLRKLEIIHTSKKGDVSC
jgi:hypothetical protein